MIIGETTILMMAIPGGSRHLGQHLVVSLTIRQEAHQGGKPLCAKVGLTAMTRPHRFSACAFFGDTGARVYSPVRFPYDWNHDAV